MTFFQKTLDFAKLIPKNSIEHNALSRISSIYVQNSYNTNNNFENKVLSFMTLQKNGTLEDIILSGEFIAYTEKNNIANQILQGIKDIHKAGIMHRDIKPDNILFDTFLNIKITDFSVSTNIDDLLANQPGSEVYSAPEVRDGNSDYKCDIYSAGLVLYYLFYERHPFEELEIDQIMEEKQKGRLPLFPVNDDPCYKFLISSFCALNPNDRPNDDEALYLINYPINEHPNNSLKFEFKPELDWIVLIHLFDNDEYPYLIDTIHPLVSLARFNSIDFRSFLYYTVDAALKGYQAAIKMLEHIDFFTISYDVDNIYFNMVNGFALDEMDQFRNYLKNFSRADFESFEKSISRYPSALNCINPNSDDSFSPLLYKSYCLQRIDVICPIAPDIFDLLTPLDSSFASTELIATSLITGSYLEADIETGLGLLYLYKFEDKSSIGPLILRLCLSFGVFLARDIINAFENNIVIDPICAFIAMSEDNINANFDFFDQSNHLEFICKQIFDEKGVEKHGPGAAISWKKWLLSSETSKFNISIEPDFFDPLSFDMWRKSSKTPSNIFPPSASIEKQFDLNPIDNTVFEVNNQIVVTPIVGKVDENSNNEDCIKMVSLVQRLYQNFDNRVVLSNPNSEAMAYAIGNILNQIKNGDNVEGCKQELSNLLSPFLKNII